ncbi:uncharacterized protein Eint_110910 [Encephalitozoon intestinalis ATCC 50506]|uniref:Uncharacterized protein n=1 Tax=Encephalitozoon intestinalis (strain ATCC 50506) TaxID=876142 RepID=E0S9W9_ENCIT|nr:uncharacterized protein Eint_110910 [Encephalitozoon intestinalis ATCC 50506]ADM12591.1 hypothetical protein Eint_110910 [Encephalitozoon intestinalis ATCC 50506]UTX46448.1 hypothetical protein GPK93_11g20580 [Encephalitozoon intestinalis]
MEDFLKQISHGYVRFQYTPIEKSFDRIYSFLPYFDSTLVVHRKPGTVPPFKLLRMCRGRVKIVVTEEPFQVIVDHLGNFNMFILLDFEFNDFEHEFLRQACIANRKSIFLFSGAQKDHTIEGQSYQTVKLDLDLFDSPVGL